VMREFPFERSNVSSSLPLVCEVESTSIITRVTVCEVLCSGGTSK
ncbi:13385_t:CDS:1, partial [Funneliformis geosporum]